MNLSTGNINFNGTHIITKEGSEPVTKTFTNDLDVLQNLKQRFKNGTITEPTNITDQSTQTISCLMDDTFEISTITFPNGNSNITMKYQDDKTTHELQVNGNDLPVTGQNKLKNEIRKVAHLIDMTTKDLLKQAQDNINNTVIELLSLKTK